MKTPVNKEGLTFIDWYNAACRYNAFAVTEGKARRAWLRGEDPTEYAVRKKR